jgi:acetyltransferase-like isoleucine patch superfamily enzyme
MIFDAEKFRRCGEDVEIGEFVAIKNPDLMSLGNHVRICEFTRITCECELGDYTELHTGVSIAGGFGRRKFALGDFSSIAAGTKIWLSSDDYRNALVTHAVPGVREFEGDVIFGKYTGCGANSVVMPDNMIPEGTVIGALSFVPMRFKFDEWSVYAGCPVRKVGERNKEAVLKPLKDLSFSI